MSPRAELRTPAGASTRWRGAAPAIAAVVVAGMGLIAAALVPVVAAALSVGTVLFVAFTATARRRLAS
ncbi:hypothetical protein [Pimelobacter sp. 30-1]|uniref:hypothetical protein n=1 Tax=Pimelobacter sp. 30-1 TaxID=2004991 RepID=UPI001C050FFA|nr:hypothetical protein [Pimelobacter sp. 30-1]MBU2698554.1 hypothetical protein [Pimelobacter sp. 30-1]